MRVNAYKRHAQTILTSLLLSGVAFGFSGCGEDEAKLATKRGLGKRGKAGEKAKSKRDEADDAGLEEDDKNRPDRPKIILTREDFSADARDPFQGFLVVADEISGETLSTAKSRNVVMAGYGFEDLTLIGIVRSGKKVQPRALFVSSDGKSKTIRQGQYFSRAEVLLASVNHDYVEIEVVDEEKAHGMNWPVGERRAIYLKNE